MNSDLETQLRPYYDAWSRQDAGAVMEFFTGDGMAQAAWTVSETHSGDCPELPATGKRIEVRASSMDCFEDDKIETMVDFWNPVEFRRSVVLA